MRNLDTTIPSLPGVFTAAQRGAAASRASKRALRSGNMTDHMVASAMCDAAASAYRAIGDWSHSVAFDVMSKRHASEVTS